MFVGKNGDSKATCMACRASKKTAYDTAQALIKQTKEATSSITMISFLELPDIVASAVNEARYIEDAGVYFSVRFAIPDEWLSLDYKEIFEEVLDIVEANDTGYRFTGSKVNTSKKSATASFVVYCSLSTIREKNCVETDNSTTSKRNVLKQIHYNCGGTMKGVIDFETSLVELTYEHHTLHELPKEESRTEPEVINFIIEEAKHKEVKLVRKNVRDRFPHTSMTPSQIYYWCQGATRHLYVRDEDQLESSKKLVAEHEHKGSKMVSNVF